MIGDLCRKREKVMSCCCCYLSWGDGDHMIYSSCGDENDWHHLYLTLVCECSCHHYCEEGE
jgi:hypothetical protein